MVDFTPKVDFCPPCLSQPDHVVLPIRRCLAACSWGLWSSNPCRGTCKRSYKHDGDQSPWHHDCLQHYYPDEQSTQHAAEMHGRAFSSDEDGDG
eukprot:5914709-Karenia_brevis.AAC.1